MAIIQIFPLNPIIIKVFHISRCVPTRGLLLVKSVKERGWQETGPDKIKRSRAETISAQTTLIYYFVQTRLKKLVTLTLN